MHIVARTQLKAFLTGPLSVYEPEFAGPLAHIADVVLADLPPTVTHLVITDHENGPDSRVTAVGDQQVQLINATYHDSGYYSLDCTRQDLDHYYAAIGGSDLAGAQGFVISAAMLVSM